MTIWNMKARVLPRDHSSHSQVEKKSGSKQTKAIELLEFHILLTSVGFLPPCSSLWCLYRSHPSRFAFQYVMFLSSFLSFIFEYFKGLIKFCFREKQGVCVPTKCLPSRNRRHRRYSYRVFWILVSSVWPILSAFTFRSRSGGRYRRPRLFGGPLGIEWALSTSRLLILVNRVVC